MIRRVLYFFLGLSFVSFLIPNLNVDIVFNSEDISNQRPMWSPDGEHIAYSSNRSGHFDIYVMDANGENNRRVIFSEATDQNPSWIGNDKLLFDSNRNGNFDLYIFNLTTQTVSQITTASGNEENPTFCNGSNLILYHSDQDGNKDIFTCDLNGENQQKITNSTAADEWAHCAPNGDEILFHSNRLDSDNWIIIHKNLKSEKAVHLNEPAHIGVPRWSASGEQIVFHRQTGDSKTWNLFKMKKDGTDVIQLTNFKGFNILPSWSPNGRKIAFCSNMSGSFEIYTVSSNGTELTRLTGD